MIIIDVLALISFNLVFKLNIVIPVNLLDLIYLRLWGTQIHRFLDAIMFKVLNFILLQIQYSMVHLFLSLFLIISLAHLILFIFLGLLPSGVPCILFGSLENDTDSVPLKFVLVADCHHGFKVQI